MLGSRARAAPRAAAAGWSHEILAFRIIVGKLRLRLHHRQLAKTRRRLSQRFACAGWSSVTNHAKLICSPQLERLNCYKATNLNPREVSAPELVHSHLVGFQTEHKPDCGRPGTTSNKGVLHLIAVATGATCVCECAILFASCINLPSSAPQTKLGGNEIMTGSFHCRRRSGGASI